MRKVVNENKMHQTTEKSLKGHCLTSEEGTKNYHVEIKSFMFSHELLLTNVYQKIEDHFWN